MDKETLEQPPFIVDMSVHFAQVYATLPANDSDPIDKFIDHVENNGLVGLPGRLKYSWDIPSDDGLWQTKFQYAKSNNLWHYHIGLPSYDQTKPVGDQTSEWVLHLIRHPCGFRTTIVHWDKHPPFKLPEPHHLLLLQSTVDQPDDK